MLYRSALPVMVAVVSIGTSAFHGFLPGQVAQAEAEGAVLEGWSLGASIGSSMMSFGE